MTSSPRDRLVSETFHRNPDRLADGFTDVTGVGTPVVSFLAVYRKYACSTFAKASAISATSRAAKFS